MKSPAFQFYPSDYLSDLKVRAMTLEERGAYWEVICHLWLEGSLPLDLKLFSKLFGQKISKFEKIWKNIESCFVIENGVVTHKRLTEERTKQLVNREKKQKAAHVKWGAHALQMQKKNDARALHLECPISSSSSSSTSSVYISADEDAGECAAISAFHAIIKPDHSLPIFSQELIIAAFNDLSGTGVDLEAVWVRVLNLWAGNNYNPRNVGSILERFRDEVGKLVKSKPADECRSVSAAELEKMLK